MSYTPWQASSADFTLTDKRIVCYDSEFVREHFYYPKLALVQLYQPDWQQARLFDPTVQDLSVLWRNIIQHNAPIVMHAGIQDLELMQTVTGELPSQIRDTQLGFALCHPVPRIGYADMVRHYLDILLPKTATRSDWLLRPLRQEQYDYAADDVGLLSRIYPLLSAELASLGRLSWWQEECAYALSYQHEVTEPYHWYKLRGAPQKLRVAHYSAAEALVNIREQMAAKMDLPRRKVLSDEKLIAIALQKPTNAADVAEHLAESHLMLSDIAMVEDAFERHYKQPVVRQKRALRLNQQQKNRFYQLEKYVRHTAHDLGISRETLATPSQMREWLIKPEDAALNRGWRQPFFSLFKG